MFHCLTSRLAPLPPLPPQLTVRLAHCGLLVTLLLTSPFATTFRWPNALTSDSTGQYRYYLTIDLLEQHLLAAETSVVVVGAARGTPHTPFFEGCSPSPLAPSYASAGAVDILSTEDVGAASASAKHRSGKGKGGRGGGGGSESGGGGSSGGSGGSGGGGSGGSGGGSGGVGGGGGGSGGSGGSGSGGSGGDRTGAQRGGSGGGQRQRQQRRSETPSPQQLCEWLFQRGASGGSVSCPYVIRTGDRAGQTCGQSHTQHRCFSRLDDAWRAEFGDAVERPHWAELLRSGVAIFDLEYDAILSAMYALSASAEGDCYRCVPPDPSIEAAALGASESSLPGTAPAEALHTFTLELDWLTPPGGLVVARSSTVLPCPVVPSGSLSGLHLPSFSTNLVSTAALQDAMVTTTTPGGQRVSISTCTRIGRHLAMFTRLPRSSLYTLATEPPQVAASAQVSASGHVAPPCSCRLLSHKTLLWHHRLGHPSLPRLRGMHSRLLVSGLPRSLPPLPPSPAPPCLPCVEGRQRAAPHSSSFPLTTAPLQSLHMDVWGPARVSGQGRERYFLLVVDDYTRPLQLREWFRADLPVLRLHSDIGGEFSSDLLRDFCRGEGIHQTFTLRDSPQQNGIAERHIGLVMEVARTSMIHADAPNFLWPFAVRYAAHQLNLWPRVSFPETSPTLRWTGKVGDASVFRGPAPSGVFQLDPLPGNAPVEVAVGSGAASGCAATGGAVLGGAESEGAESGGAEPGGEESGGAGPGRVERGGSQPGGVEPGGAESEGAESEGAEPWGAASSGDPAAGGPGGTAAAGPRGARTRGTGAARISGVGGDGAGDPTEPGAAGAGGSGTGAGAGGAGVGGSSAGGARAGGAGAVDPGAGGPGGTVRPRPYFVPLLQQWQLSLQPVSPLPSPSPYTEQSSVLTKRREPASRPVSPVRTVCLVPRSHPPPVLGTHAMSPRLSSIPLRVPLLAPLESSLPEVPDPESLATLVLAVPLSLVSSPPLSLTHLLSLLLCLLSLLSCLALLLPAV
ncbi:unnamed protein product [Closterium sp. NIES-54]